MIDKKKLIEELLDCVADATDTETQITSLTMAGMLMSEVLDEVLTIPDVVGRSEQLVCDECGDTGRAYPTLSEPDGVECEKCNHKFERVEKSGEFQGNQCDCGEWEDLT